MVGPICKEFLGFLASRGKICLDVVYEVSGTVVSVNKKFTVTRYLDFVNKASMDSSTLFEDVISPIRNFLCKIHGIVDDHNYSPTLHILFKNKLPDSNIRDQDVVNLLWTMLEQLQNVLDGSDFFPKKIKSWMDEIRQTSTKAIQTDDSIVMTDSKIVQITCPNKEFNRRIDAFIKRKRIEVDNFNRREFCRVNNDPGHSSCARADAVFVPRQSKKSILKVKRVFNVMGERDKEVIDLDGLKHWPPVHPSAVLPVKNLPRDLRERCENLYSVLNEKTYLNENANIYTILKDLEGRVVYLESLSPEYFHASRVSPMEMLNTHADTGSRGNEKQSTNTLSTSSTLSMFNKDSFMLLDQRIFELQKKLVSKAKHI